MQMPTLCVGTLTLYAYTVNWLAKGQQFSSLYIYITVHPEHIHNPLYHSAHRRQMHAINSLKEARPRKVKQLSCHQLIFHLHKVNTLRSIEIEEKLSGDELRP